MLAERWLKLTATGVLVGARIGCLQVRLFAPDIRYEDFNYPEPFIGTAQVRASRPNESNEP